MNKLIKYKTYLLLTFCLIISALGIGSVFARFYFEKEQELTTEEGQDVFGIKASEVLDLKVTSSTQIDNLTPINFTVKRDVQETAEPLEYEIIVLSSQYQGEPLEIALNIEDREFIGEAKRILKGSVVHSQFGYGYVYTFDEELFITDEVSGTIAISGLSPQIRIQLEVRSVNN